MIKYGERPNIRWPIIALFTISVFATIVSILLGFIELNNINITNLTSIQKIIINITLYITSIIIATFASYAQFTVVHESVHSTISKNKYINNIIGISAAIWLGPLSNWILFKKHHLQHHSDTNDVDKDPDMWCSKNAYGGEKYLVLRWLTLDIHYAYIYIIECVNNCRVSIPILTNQICMIFFTYFIFNCFSIGQILQYWIIPSRLAILLLSFAFDYLPHYPHDIKKKENKYKTTSYISCPWYIKLFLSPISFYQDYHIIHHERPYIPFYEYAKVWDERKEDLINKGVRINKIFPQILGDADIVDSESVLDIGTKIIKNLHR